MSNSVAPRALASLSMVSRALYSASLVVVAYCRRMARLMMSPSGNSSITPIPHAFFVDDPSIWAVHLEICYSSSFWLVIFCGELCYEISQRLSFDRCSGSIVNVEFVEFDRPLYESSDSIGFVHCLPQ